VELRNGKVKTGAILAIDDSGFQLRDGIIHTNRISYSELKAVPHHVAAVGRHIGNGFKWAGLGTGIGVGCILAIPALLVFLPLLATGAIQD
jgi:hypothetical protein